MVSATTSDGGIAKECRFFSVAFLACCRKTKLRCQHCASLALLWSSWAISFGSAIEMQPPPSNAPVSNLSSSQPARAKVTVVQTISYRQEDASALLAELEDALRTHRPHFIVCGYSYQSRVTRGTVAISFFHFSLSPEDWILGDSVVSLDENPLLQVLNASFFLALLAMLSLSENCRANESLRRLWYSWISARKGH